MNVHYSTERARLYFADALEVLAHLPTASADCTITDPPYSSGGMIRGDRMLSTRDKYQSSDTLVEHPEFTGDNRDQRAFGYWSALWLSEARRVTKPGGMLCCFVDWRQLPTLTDAVQAGGWVWRGIVPWDKVVARPQPNRFRSQAEYVVWATNGPRSFELEGAVYADGIIRVTTVPTADREHSTQKPVELLETILRVACPPGGLVLDPFVGSGTTGVAAIRTGRLFVGSELDPVCLSIATRRIETAETEAASQLNFEPTDTRRDSSAAPSLFAGTEAAAQ